MVTERGAGVGMVGNRGTGADGAAIVVLNTESGTAAAAIPLAAPEFWLTTTTKISSVGKDPVDVTDNSPADPDRVPSDATGNVNVTTPDALGRIIELVEELSGTRTLAVAIADVDHACVSPATASANEMLDNC